MSPIVLSRDDWGSAYVGTNGRISGGGALFPTVFLVEFSVLRHWSLNNLGIRGLRSHTERGGRML